MGVFLFVFFTNKIFLSFSVGAGFFKNLFSLVCWISLPANNSTCSCFSWLFKNGKTTTLLWVRGNRLLFVLYDSCCWQMFMAELSPRREVGGLNRCAYVLQGCVCNRGQEVYLDFFPPAVTNLRTAEDEAFGLVYNLTSLLWNWKRGLDASTKQTKTSDSSRLHGLMMREWRSIPFTRKCNGFLTFR